MYYTIYRPQQLTAHFVIIKNPKQIEAISPVHSIFDIGDLHST